MQPNLLPKLIFLFSLMLFGMFLSSNLSYGYTVTCSCFSSCDGHYCEIFSGDAGVYLFEIGHTICLPWQKCTIGENTGPDGRCEFKGCLLSPPCIKKPGNPRYYDNPNLPTDVFAPQTGISPTNVYLPVKLDWDDVEGWKDGWIGVSGPTNCYETCLLACQEIGWPGVTCLSCGESCDGKETVDCPCTPGQWRANCRNNCSTLCKVAINFYQIKITGELRTCEAMREIEELQDKIVTEPEQAAEYEKEIKRIRENELEINEYKTFLDESEFIPCPCLLKSGETYQWQVRACGSKNENTCGPWSDIWSFSTSPSLELVSPADPDWAGAGGAVNSPLPTTLDWCELEWCEINPSQCTAEEIGSYRVQIYLLENGVKKCHPSLLENGDCGSWLLRKKREAPLQSEKMLFSDFLDEEMQFFTKETTYFWKIKICDDNGINCEAYGQEWKFSTEQKNLPETSLVSPPDDPTGQKPVGLPLILDWQKDAGINSWWYRIGSLQEFTKDSQSRSLDCPRLSLNTSYQWQVLSCWDFEGKECESSWSDVYHFKTTGQPPNLVYPTAGAVDIPIPVDFDWQDVPGAESYIIHVQGDDLDIEETVDESSLSLDFPEYPIHQETNYIWQVKTCAREEGQICGEYSTPQGFRTFRLPPPQNPSYPQDNGMFFTDERFLSWEKVTGAKAYQYQISYLSLAAEEIDETCPALVGKQVFEEPKITLGNSGIAELRCLGEYQWQARACLDQECQEFGSWSDLWTFTFLEGGRGQGGLIPCGRASDNPETPWNEREPCQIKHLFLSIKIIIDFLLLRAIPLILVLLVIATALVFFTSLGQAITMARVMSLWKAAGIGIAIILLAWLTINIFLGIIGYNIGVFGNWYNL